MTEPRIEDRPEQPYVAVHREVTDGIPAAVDSAFPELFGWLGAHGVAPAGPPFLRVTEVDPDGTPLELECAAPVADDAVATAPVRRGVLPAGRYVTLVHVGPYRSETARDLGAAREDLEAWIAGQGIVTARPSARGSSPACAVDRLEVGPDSEPDPSRWRTALELLIVDGP
jgi:hypothetical protein